MGSRPERSRPRRQLSRPSRGRNVRAEHRDETISRPRRLGLETVWRPIHGLVLVSSRCSARTSRPRSSRSRELTSRSRPLWSRAHVRFLLKSPSNGLNQSPQKLNRNANNQSVQTLQSADHYRLMAEQSTVINVNPQ